MPEFGYIAVEEMIVVNRGKGEAPPWNVSFVTKNVRYDKVSVPRIVSSERSS